MITRNDCLLLLAEISSTGIDTSEVTSMTVKSASVDLDVVKFINSHRQLDLSKFYEKIRRSYNQKHSQLYKQIVKSDEVEKPDNVIVTLSAMLTQILLFSKDVDNKQMFLKHARAQEITQVLNNYFKTYDLTQAIKLLRLIKADLKCLEMIK